MYSSSGFRSYLSIWSSLLYPQLLLSLRLHHCSAYIIMCPDHVTIHCSHPSSLSHVSSIVSSIIFPCYHQSYYCSRFHMSSIALGFSAIISPYNVIAAERHSPLHHSAPSVTLSIRNLVTVFPFSIKPLCHYHLDFP